MITIDLTDEQLEHLTDGASRFGRCSILTQTLEGDDAFVVVTQNHRRGRPPKSRAQAQGVRPQPNEAGFTKAESPS